MPKLRKAARDRAKRWRRRVSSLYRNLCESGNDTYRNKGMADQVKLLFVDCNMHEYTREDYIKITALIHYPSGKQSRNGVKRNGKMGKVNFDVYIFGLFSSSF